MKKFKILGIIAIIAMAANFFLNFEDGWSSFLEGYHEGARTYKSVPDNLYRVSLEVKPLESIANDSIFNQVAGQKVPYWTSEITTYTQPSLWITLVMIISAISMFAFIIGFYLFVRFLLEVSKRNVFCEANVWRIRFFVYSYTAIVVSMELFAWIAGGAAIAQTQIPGYQIIDHAEASPEWTPVIMMIILAECFAIGVKMKEEQDLTI
jgi:hypothetical protein